MGGGAALREAAGLPGARECAGRARRSTEAERVKDARQAPVRATGEEIPPTFGMKLLDLFWRAIEGP